MSTDVAVRTQQELTILTNDQLQFIASTEFVPPGLRGNLPAILACVATGRALGIADMTALRSIHIIDGKATFSAELMVMLARQRGHSIQGSVTEGAAKVTGKRADNGDTMTVEWTLAMAERAGLLGKQNWRKYPEAMLWARAVSQLCRELFPDCFAGATYTLEELGAEHTDAKGEPPTIDMNDPDIPFGDAFVPEHQPPATAAMKKKLNVLVGKLRPDIIETIDLWRHVGRDPVDSEDGELHWSPLRDSLTKAEAHSLIDWLEPLSQPSRVGDPSADIPGEEAGVESVGSAPAAQPSQASPAASPTEILELAAQIIGARPDAAAAIEKHAVEHSPAEHLAWLRRQASRLVTA